MTILRVIASIVLGLIVFLSVLAFLAAGSLRSHFLSVDFYTESLAENNAYNRLYDAVLVPRIKEQIDEKGRADFLGGLRVDPDDVNGLLTGILTPRELRRQVEAAIEGAVDYLNKEEDPATGEPIEVPEVYVDLRPILGTRVPTPPGLVPVEGTAKPVIARFLVRQLRNNVVFLPPPEGSMVEQIAALSRQLSDALAQLQDPQFPLELPSMAGIPPELRAQIYDNARGLTSAISEEVRAELDEADGKIKQKLLEPDPEDALVEALAIVIVPLAEPLIDQGFNEYRDDQLDAEDRFDPIARLADNRDMTKVETLEDIDNIRDWLERGKTYGSWLAIAIIVAASILLSLVHLPRIRSALAWPGLTLFLSGGAFLGIAIALRSQLPDRLESFLESGSRGCNALAGEGSSVSEGLCEIGVDVGRSMATEVAGGLIVPSAIVLVVGGALLFVALISRRGGTRRAPRL